MIRAGLRFMLIGFAAGLSVAAFIIALDVGLDRELDRREAAEFDFVCNFQKGC